MSSDDTCPTEAPLSSHTWGNRYCSIFSLLDKRKSDSSPVSMCNLLCNEVTRLTNNEEPTGDDQNNDLHLSANDPIARLVKTYIEEKRSKMTKPADDLEAISSGEEYFDHDDTNTALSWEYLEIKTEPGEPAGEHSASNSASGHRSSCSNRFTQVSSVNLVPRASINDAKAVDPRMASLCAKGGQPSPYEMLQRLIKKNYKNRDSIISVKFTKDSVSKPFKLCTMTVGKHTVSVKYKEKEEGKQKASQEMLRLFNPKIDNLGSLLTMYGNEKRK